MEIVLCSSSQSRDKRTDCDKREPFWRENDSEKKGSFIHFPNKSGSIKRGKGMKKYFLPHLFVSLAPIPEDLHK
jgi:hypothetical protein